MERKKTEPGISELIFELKRKCCRTEETIRTETNLSQAEYKVIEVMVPGEEIRSVELAGRMSLSPSRCSRIVENMTKRKYLSASPSTADRRSLALRLTPAGARIHGKIKSLKEDCDARIASGLNPDDEKQIVRALTLLVDIL